MAERKETKKAPEVPESGSSKKKLLIIIGAVLLVVLIGVGIALFFLLQGDDKKNADQQQGSQVPVPELNQTTDIGPMIDINDFIVNIISAENNHYVKASFTLELSNKLVLDEAEKRMAQIRDSILLLVGNKTYDELQDLQGKKQLKAELSSKLNAILQTGQVKSIYFTDFVVQ